MVYKSDLAKQSHVKALLELLSEYPQIPYHSIVVFDNRSKLKIDVTSKVVYTSELLFTIQMISETKVSDDQVKDIYHMILSNNQTNRKAKKLMLNKSTRTFNRKH
ncbi:hypothetical protein [Ammoniphilus resinae]|uniref:Uncharacterized protein n=1 Tax=Ammoniphilus resinae TaxID=861532 RepID=A0ABS4GVB5_9BACL|nr:hypothetical protein [Ammoniphilus resinae]MBP1934208.1 hypothetical protein [Ammoniphilus resinae]